MLSVGKLHIGKKKDALIQMEEEAGIEQKKKLRGRKLENEELKKEGKKKCRMKEVN